MCRSIAPAGGRLRPVTTPRGYALTSLHGPKSTASSAAEPTDGLRGRRWGACCRGLPRWGACHGRGIMVYLGVQRRRGDRECSSTSVTARCSNHLARGHGSTNPVRSCCEEKASTRVAMGGDCWSVPAHRSRHGTIHPAVHLVSLLTIATCRYIAPGPSGDPPADVTSA